MITISEEAMDVFHREAIKRSDAAVVEYLRRRFPQVCAGREDGDIAAFVQRVRSDVAGFGITHDDDVATAADLTLMYGNAFWDQAWAVDVMGIEMLPGHEKMELLRRRVRTRIADL